jgi:hypothetical protein
MYGNWINCKLLKDIKIPLKNKTKPNVKGKKIFQPININWSNLNLGKLALTNIKRKVTIIVLNAKKNSWLKQTNKIFLEKKFKFILTTSINPPPKKKITNKLDINKILVYSPRKKAAKVIAE